MERTLRSQPDPRGRHELAVRQSLRWAERAAAEGNYGHAIGWLAAIEAVDGKLPEGWEERRRAWETAGRG